jgi:hypothetical protein
MSGFDVDEDYSLSIGHAAAEALVRKYGARAFTFEIQENSQETDPLKIELLANLHNLEEALYEGYTSP